MSGNVSLVEQKGPTSIYISVQITDDGDLLFSGQDLGEAPQKVFGDSDYEYWLTIKATDKDQVLLALIEKHYSGNTTLISELMEYLKSKEITYEFHSY
jgi:hypothetical protein